MQCCSLSGKEHEVYSYGLDSLIRACRASSACQELTRRSFPQPLLLGARNTMKTNRVRAARFIEPSPLYMYPWTCDQVNYPRKRR
jgi:hypothetical protein